MSETVPHPTLEHSSSFQQLGEGPGGLGARNVADDTGSVVFIRFKECIRMLDSSSILVFGIVR